MVKVLKRSGQLDRTAIILTSDHGFHLGQFAMVMDKRLPYETDIRVPLIIKPPGRRSKTPIVDTLAVVSIDLAPTVLELAGIPTPRDMDGLSLLPLLHDADDGQVFNERCVVAVVLINSAPIVATRVP